MKRFAGDEINAAAEVLKNDGCIAAATDTVFGVCARISEKGQEKLYDVKHRPHAKRFPLMCLDLDQVREIAEVSEDAERVIRAFMPGPLTVILRRHADLPDFISGGTETLAVRLAATDQLHSLIRAVGEPLFMTSANQSGMPECRSAEEIENACPELDGILEGTVHYNRASTIVDLTGDAPKILREGPITLEQIEQELRRKKDD